MDKTVVLLRSNPVAPDPPVEKMADALLSQKFQVIILGWDRASDYLSTADELQLPNGKARVVRFGIKASFGGGIKRNLKALIKFQKRLFNWLKKNRNDYLYIHAFDFDTGYVAKRIAKKYNKKLVYHILDFYIDSHLSMNSTLKKVIKKAEFSVINHADATIICTEKRREQIKGSFPKNLTVIHNTPNSEIRLDSFTLPESTDRCRIVYVGILGGGRFIHEIMNAVKKDERFELHIGGFGPMESQVAQVANECERVVFYGKLPYSKTLALEKACDVMTAIYDPKVPNHRYAAPNKFYESLMLGKPIIMARDTGFDEVITVNDIGEVMEFSDVGLQVALNNLVSKRNQWDAMKNRSLELYQTQFSWKIMNQRIVELYSELVIE